MGKRGPKPKRAAEILWTSNVAYALGLLATDGCLSSNGRHIDLTSKDVEQLENFKKCFELSAPISYKKSGYTGKLTTRIQFSDVSLYRFLESVGFTPAKTKTMGTLSVPDVYFFDFLRGHHDGDGCFYSYWDPRWKASFMFYLTFVSASKTHVDWLQQSIERLLNIKGRASEGHAYHQLRFAKKDSLILLREMYKNKSAICLSRKKLKIEKALSIVGERL